MVRSGRWQGGSERVFVGRGCRWRPCWLVVLVNLLGNLRRGRVLENKRSRSKTDRQMVFKKKHSCLFTNEINLSPSDADMTIATTVTELYCKSRSAHCVQCRTKEIMKRKRKPAHTTSSRKSSTKPATQLDRFLGTRIQLSRS